MASFLTGTEILKRQRQPPPGRVADQQSPTAQFGGGNSPVRHDVIVTPADWGKLAMWEKEGCLGISSLGEAPVDGQLYARQNGVWVPVSGGQAVINRWDDPSLSWDQPGLLWDQVGALSQQIARLEAKIEELERKT